MAISTWIKNRTQTLLGYEKRPKQLALACSTAIYIGFSPFIGLHTIMKFVFSWFFGLSFPVLFSISTLINNPWTMVPVYGMGYFVGQLVLDFIGINHYAYNPSFMASISSWIAPLLGTGEFSLLAFMVGGNLLGIVGALASYPLFNMLITNAQASQGTAILRVVDGARIIRGVRLKASPMLNKVIRIARLTRRGYETSSTK